MAQRGTQDPARNLQEEIGKRDPFALPEQEAYLNLVRTHAQLSAAMARLFKAHGLSDPQYNALRIVAGAGRDGVRSETIGRHMVASSPDTTRLIDRLEAGGLVDRRPHPTDRRCVLVFATAKGRRLLGRLDPEVERLHREQLGHLGRKDLADLSRLLFRARHP